jgi:hypothetical protein
MGACPECGRAVERRFRYCPWCAAPQRLKLTDFFRPHPLIDEGKALRVSRYLGAAPAERHVRFSVWDESEDVVRAEAAVSLEEDEAARLARFLVDPVGRRPAAESDTEAPTLA